MINYLAVSANCDSLFTPEGLEIIREILGYFRIIAPILLIIFVALDYGSAIINNDKDALSKANSRVVSRAIGVILLFFVPTIVKFILDISSFSQYSSDYLCENATGTAEKYVITYTPKAKKKTNNVVNSNDVQNPREVEQTNDSNQKVGDKANPKNSVCLKEQPGLRDKYQSELESKINSAGRESRAGVVAAAIYLSSEIGIKIPYFPGGCHSMSCLNKGIIETFGCQKSVKHNADRWPPTLPDGLDCSGFTFWTYGTVFGQKAYINSEIHNAANGSATIVINGKKDSFRLETVPINKKNYDFIKATLMPGDLVGSDGHIGMVIDTSNLSTNGTYTVAHASSGRMQVAVEQYKLGDSKWNRFVLMRKFFLKYDCNIKSNQSACSNLECVNDKNCNSFGLKY